MSAPFLPPNSAPAPAPTAAPMPTRLAAFFLPASGLRRFRTTAAAPSAGSRLVGFAVKTVLGWLAATAVASKGDASVSINISASTLSQILWILLIEFSFRGHSAQVPVGKSLQPSPSIILQPVVSTIHPNRKLTRGSGWCDETTGTLGTRGQHG